VKKHRPLLAVLLGTLLVGTWSFSSGQSIPQPPSETTFWFGFLVLLPLGLAALVWTERRWAAIACVMYGTVGLALDLATIVQVLTKDPVGDAALLKSGISGVLNFLVILLGGRSFLDVSEGPRPPESRPPNPLSPGSSAPI